MKGLWSWFWAAVFVLAAWVCASPPPREGSQVKPPRGGVLTIKHPGATVGSP